VTIGLYTHIEDPEDRGAEEVGETSEIRCFSDCAPSADNQWHHVAMTWDPNGTIEHFVDGCQVTATPKWPPLGCDYAASLAEQNTFVIQRLGRPNVSNPDRVYGPGLMDEVRLYARALTACEVRAIYEAEGGL